jgi:2-haloacid dehalogenase
MSYKAVFLDADDTIFNFAKTSAFALEQVCRTFNITFTAELLNTYESINTELWKQLELGKINKIKLRTERFRRLFTALNISEGAGGVDSTAAGECYIRFLSESVFLIPGAEKLLQQLKGVPVIIVTNGIAEVQKSRIARSGLDGLYKGMIISEEAGWAKPDPRIFEQAMLFTEGIPKKEIIMLGDSLSSDIQGANNAAIDSCWFNPSGATNASKAVPDYEIKELSGFLAIIGL